MTQVRNLKNTRMLSSVRVRGKYIVSAS